MPWKKMLAYVTGEVDQCLLSHVEYLIEENRILRRQISIKQEYLDRMIVFGERMLKYLVTEYMTHYHTERNHQGISNVIPFPDERLDGTGKIRNTGGWVVC